MTRGVYDGTRVGSPRAVVGASIWQTPGGVQSELNQINDDINVFGHEITEFVTSLPGFPRVEPRWSPVQVWYGGVFSPWWQNWGAFYADNKGWWDNLWWNHAPEAEQFAKQLVEMRDVARRLGVGVLSPTPTQFAPSLLADPTDNVFDRTARGVGDALGDVKTFTKVALYGGLALLGVFALTSVTHSLRSNTDPAERYLTYARGRR